MTIRFASTLFVGVCFLGVLSSGGCGGGKTGPKLAPVTGVVTYKTKALSGATLTFIPIEKTEGVGGTAKTDVDGKYKAVYTRGGDGLPAGKYKVAVSKRVMPDGSEPPEDVSPIESPAKETLPAAYSNPESTRLDALVSDDGKEINFNLK